jgi:hypothetical protein
MSVFLLFYGDKKLHETPRGILPNIQKQNSVTRKTGGHEMHISLTPRLKEE